MATAKPARRYAMAAIGVIVMVLLVLGGLWRDFIAPAWNAEPQIAGDPISAKAQRERETGDASRRRCERDPLRRC